MFDKFFKRPASTRRNTAGTRHHFFLCLANIPIISRLIFRQIDFGTLSPCFLIHSPFFYANHSWLFLALRNEFRASVCTFFSIVSFAQTTVPVINGMNGNNVRKSRHIWKEKAYKELNILEQIRQHFGTYNLEVTNWSLLKMNSNGTAHEYFISGRNITFIAAIIHFKSLATES